MKTKKYFQKTGTVTFLGDKWSKNQWYSTFERCNPSVTQGDSRLHFFEGKMNY